MKKARQTISVAPKDTDYRRPVKEDEWIEITFPSDISSEDLADGIKRGFAMFEDVKGIPHPSLGEGLVRPDSVNHPSHYQHPSGVECITVARHCDFNVGNALKYLWRAGLKHEEGMTDREKQIEDLQKAIFYIQDEIEMLKAEG